MASFESPRRQQHVTVQHFTGGGKLETYTVPLKSGITWEDVCMDSVRTPVVTEERHSGSGEGNVGLDMSTSERHVNTFHLYRMYNSKEGMWLAPNKLVPFSAAEWSPHDLELRIAFAFPEVRRSLANLHELDQASFFYLFYQIRHDFITDAMETKYGAEPIPEDYCLGLGCLDMVRVQLQRSIPSSRRLLAEYHWKDMIPRSMLRKFNIALRLKLKFSHQFKSTLEQEYDKYRCMSNSMRSALMNYMVGMLEKYAPSYLCQTFECEIGENGGLLLVSPNDPKHPGITFFYETFEGKKMTVPITKIPAISDISFQSESMILLSLDSACAKHINFFTRERALSFVTIVEGYYRLTVDYHRNMCPEVFSPMVKIWETNKCFGPVSTEWAITKMRSLTHVNGVYLIKMRSREFREYALFLYTMGRICSLLVKYDASDQTYRLDTRSVFSDSAPEISFSSLKKLLKHYRDHNYPNIKLTEIVSPKHKENIGLLLCKPCEEEKVTSAEQSSRVVCVHAGEDYELMSRVGETFLSDVYDGHYGNTPVHITALKSQEEVASIAREFSCWGGDATIEEHFRAGVQDSLKWRCNYLLRTMGVSLSPFHVIREKTPVGRLPSVFRRFSGGGGDPQTPGTWSSVEFYHCAQIVEQLATALDYLCCHDLKHGDIRCENILVSVLTRSRIEVKLKGNDFNPLLNSLPLSHQLNIERLPWIPLERYNDLSLLTHEADLFSAGVTIWEVFAKGDRPLRGKSQYEIKNFYESGHTLPESPSYLRAVSAKPDLEKGLYKLMRDVVHPLYCSDSMVRPASLTVVKEIRQIAYLLRPNRYDLPDDSDTSPKNGHEDHTTMLKRYLPQIPHSVHIAASNIIIQGGAKPLGKGHYGEVFRATLSYDLEEPQTVAVKRLYCHDDEVLELSEEFEKELAIMRELHHANIVSVLGHCKDYYSQSAPGTGFRGCHLLVMEFVENNTMVSFLNKHKGSVTESLKLRFAISICKGMQYLHEKGIIHRDLAGRNVLVTKKPYDVKISDFGLARHLKSEDYYRIDKNSDIPAPWYPLEVFEQQRFYKESDVYSYGVTLWELYSEEKPNLLKKGDEPHALLYRLRNEEKLPRPLLCPAEVYSLMVRCWRNEHTTRPPFSEIRSYLEDIHQ